MSNHIYKAAIQTPKISASGNFLHCSNLLYGQKWNAGGFAPQYVEIDLQGEYNIGSIRLHIEQLPDGETEHHVTAGIDGNPTWVIAHFYGHTSHGQVLFASFYPVKARYIRVTTRKSPSWVCWQSIVIE